MAARKQPYGPRAVCTPVIMAALSVLSACAVGPDFKRPASPPNAGYTPAPLPAKTDSAPTHGGEAQHFAIGRDIQFDWWTLFHSPALDALVQQAFKANPTIDAAEAALKQAQENVSAQQGYFFPTVTAGYTFQRQQLAGNMGGNSPGLQGNGTYITSTPYKPATYNFHTAQLTVGYAPDVFGGNRREVESLRAQADNQRFLLEATYITLASNVVAAALQEASTRAQIAAVNEIIRVNQESLDILHHQFRTGYAMRIDVAAQEAALAQAKAMLPPLQKQYEQTRDLIRALVGNLPNQDVPETFDAGFVTPAGRPAGQPAVETDRAAAGRSRGRGTDAFRQRRGRRRHRQHVAAVQPHRRGRRRGDGVRPDVQHGRSVLGARFGRDAAAVRRLHPAAQETSRRSRR